MSDMKPPSPDEALREFRILLEAISCRCAFAAEVLDRQYPSVGDGYRRIGREAEDVLAWEQTGTWRDVPPRPLRRP